MTEGINRQLSFKELKSLKGVRYSRMTVWRKVRDGKFPQSYYTDTGQVFWWEREIDEYLASLKPGKGRKPPEKGGLINV